MLFMACRGSNTNIHILALLVTDEILILYSGKGFPHAKKKGGQPNSGIGFTCKPNDMMTYSALTCNPY